MVAMYPEAIVARERLKPSPVRYHRVPEWLRKACLRVAKPGRHETRRGFRSLHRAVDEVCGSLGRGWLDHYGATVIDGKTCFVAEPYLNDDDIAHAKAFASAIGVTMTVSKLSYWWPVQTTRLIFWPPDVTIPPAEPPAALNGQVLSNVNPPAVSPPNPWKGSHNG